MKHVQILLQRHEELMRTDDRHFFRDMCLLTGSQGVPTPMDEGHNLKINVPILLIVPRNHERAATRRESENANLSVILRLSY